MLLQFAHSAILQKINFRTMRVVLAQASNHPAPLEGAKRSVKTEQPIAAPARPKRRHVWLLMTFFLWVFLPAASVGIYLYTVAEDQYASYVGFAVRTEETSSAVEILGGITELAGSSSSDTDILFKFIRGRQMISAIDQNINLKSIYHKPSDPVFSLNQESSREDVERYWNRIVKIFYDRNSGLIELRVNAFTPEDAQRIAEAIVAESTDMINELSAVARADTTRYAKEELDHSIVRLKSARKALNTFRTRTQIIDPLADTAGRMSLLNSLQTQLAAALIELDLLRQTGLQSDPRIVQEERRVQVIKDRIEEERLKIGGNGPEDDTYSQLVGEYEALAVDLEFAEKSYLSALAAYDAAQAEAQRKSRYLATYIPPTLAEDPEYPKRFTLLALLTSGFLLSWSIALLIYYSVRDRR